MNFSEYQEQAARTANTSAEVPPLELNFALGMTDEAGEVIGLVCQPWVYTTDAEMVSELGDVLWYTAMLALRYGITDCVLIEPPFFFNIDLLLQHLAWHTSSVAGMVKKQFYHGHDMDMTELRAGIWKVLNAISNLARHYGLTMNQIADANIAKLQARYPDGFDQARSREREQ